MKLIKQNSPGLTEKNNPEYRQNLEHYYTEPHQETEMVVELGGLESSMTPPASG